VEAIYSGFAIVIVTMLWLYLSWLILLLGAQLAFYLQNPSYLRLGRRAEGLSNALKERLALAAMVLVALEFEQPGDGFRVDGLAARLRVPRHYVDTVVAALQDAGLLSQTDRERLIPARDPRRIAVAAILDAVRHAPRDALAGADGDWNPSVRATAARVDRAVRDALDGQSLADLLDQEAAAAVPR
jgi:membrane protein